MQPTIGLEAALADPENCQLLVLRVAEGETIDEAIHTLPALHELRVRFDRAEDVPDHLAELHHLNTLLLTATRPAPLPEFVYGFRALPFLRLQTGNHTGPPSGRRIENIERLELYSVGEELLSSLHRFASVTSLRIAGSTVPPTTTLPPALQRLELDSHLDLDAHLGDDSPITELILGKPYKEVPEVVSRMPNLTHLRLHQAPLPEFLQDMPGLRGLQVRTTPPFPDWLGDLRGLEELSLRSDRSWQDNAPDWSVLRRLSGMRKLSLKLFYLREVDYSFLEDLQELRELELYSSGEATLPDGLSPHLEVLALEGSQGFRDLPSDLARFDQLRVLKAELDGEARGLPEDLSKLHRLEVVELKLPRGSSGEVPDLSGLPGLRSLKIKGLAHSTFPASACGLKHLEEVLLTSGRYASLDPNIGNLGALRTLELPNGALSSVPDSVCELTRLEKLDLSYNPLERLPEGIDRLTRLHELNLRNTALKTLPAGVGRLARLQYLTLWECKQLEALCPSVAGMKSLKRIIALDCALRSLPEDLGLLPSIEWLWLGNNQLRAVPDSLYEISDATFRELRLTGNEFHADQIPRLKALEKRIVRLEVKMPRTAKTIAIPEEAPTDPLSDKVVAQLERLGATPSDPSPRTHERFPFGQWPVPDAIRQFRGWKWEWKTLESDRDDAWMVQLGISGGLDEHEIIHHQPVICFGHMDGGNYSFLMRLDDPDPTDPKVYRIDHDAFGDQSAPVFSPSLSRFLGSLKA